MKKFLILTKLIVLLAIISSCVSYNDTTVDLFSKVQNVSGLGSENQYKVNSQLDSLYKNHPSTFSLYLPYNDSKLQLDLSIIDVYGDGFKVTFGGKNIDAPHGYFYKGVVVGDSTSFVSLSLFKDEVIGSVSSAKYGTLNIGLDGISKMYAIAQTSNTFDFNCGTDSIKHPKTKLENILQVTNQTGCIGVDYELDYSVYQYFNGNNDAAIKWVTSAFSAVSTIYSNEQLKVKIKSINIDATSQGYDPSNTATELTQFQSKRVNDPNYTGNVAQLIIAKTGGAMGGIAWVNAINTQYRFSVAQVLMQYAPYPSYSWTIEVLTHEMGHNFGSPHTQSCTWVGGPIDNCYPQEGTCNPGPTPPPGGGTIMSYCHLKPGIGITFSNGFGKQPGDLIRSRYQSAVLSSCDVKVDTPVVVKPDTPIVNTVNYAYRKTVTLSSTFNPLPNTNPYYYAGLKATDGIKYPQNAFSTLPEFRPWVKIDLGVSRNVKTIKLYTRASSLPNSINEFKIFISDNSVTWDSSANYSFKGVVAMNSVVVIPVNGTGRYFTMIVNNVTVQYFQLSEIEVF